MLNDLRFVCLFRDQLQFVLKASKFVQCEVLTTKMMLKRGNSKIRGNSGLFQAISKGMFRTLAIRFPSLWFTTSDCSPIE